MPFSIASLGKFFVALARSMLTSTRAYDSGDYSDLTIQCGSRTWKVHRLIIYSASTFFLKAGEGEFKVRGSLIHHAGFALGSTH